MKLAYSAWAMPRRPIAEQIAIVRDCGYAAIELVSSAGAALDALTATAAERRAIRQQVDAAGLDLPSIAGHGNVLEPDPESRPARMKQRNPAVAARYDLTREGNQRKLDIVEALEKVAEQAGLSLTHMAIAFTLAHPAVTSAIVGPRTMSQVEDLLAGADVRLDADTLDAIDGIVAPGEVIENADGRVESRNQTTGISQADVA